MRRHMDLQSENLDSSIGGHGDVSVVNDSFLKTLNTSISATQVCLSMVSSL